MSYLRAFAPVLAWGALIFSLSTDAGGASHTNADLDQLLARFFPQWNQTLTNVGRDALHFYVRKTAHVTEYAILGVLLLRAWRLVKLARPGRAELAAWLAATAYAATDEFHQVFVPGRTPKVTDVLLDSCGAALGVALLAWVTRKGEMT